MVSFGEYRMKFLQVTYQEIERIDEITDSQFPDYVVWVIRVYPSSHYGPLSVLRI